MRFLFSLVALNLTLIATGQTVAFTEDFQSGIPATWTIVDNDNNTPHPSVSEFDEAWISAEDPDSSTNFVAGATSYFEPVGQADRWLITPQLSLTAYGNLFSWTAKSHDASFPDSYLLMISTTGNAISDFTDTITGIFGEFDLNQRRTVNLSDSGYINQNVYVAFRLRTEDGFILYVDDVELVVDDPAAVDEIFQPEVRFKNLGDGLVEFTADVDFKRVVVMNALGQRLGQFNSLNQFKIETKELLFIHFETESGSFTKKFRLN